MYPLIFLFCLIIVVGQCAGQCFTTLDCPDQQCQVCINEDCVPKEVGAACHDSRPFYVGARCRIDGTCQGYPLLCYLRPFNLPHYGKTCSDVPPWDSSFINDIPEDSRAWLMKMLNN